MLAWIILNLINKNDFTDKIISLYTFTLMYRVK